MTGRSWFLSIVVPGAAALALGAGALSIAANTPDRPLMEPATAPPGQPGTAAGEARRVGPEWLGAVGLVEPAGQEIAIGSHRSGIVERVLVVPGARVEEGAPLFTLDRREAAAELAVRRRDLAAAEARQAEVLAEVPGLAAEVTAAEAAVAAAAAELIEAQDLVRTAERVEVGTAITERERTRRRNAAEAAAARRKQADADLARARADLARYRPISGTGPRIAVAQAEVDRAAAAMDQAMTTLDRLTVRAPGPATVLQVNLRAGEFAQAGALSDRLMVLGRLEPLHVRADIDEADIPRFDQRAAAWASLRGAAGLQVRLAPVRVEPIVVPKTSLTGAGDERVDTRVLRVVYALEPGLLPAYPGQQVDLFIRAGSRAPTPGDAPTCARAEGCGPALVSSSSGQLEGVR